ncbi:hypothetical protein HDU76_006469 [Blyttiomyces sp. JEL0837]|nr:hypothetical protein HDU76_006469 [Blyttiomyces sp. JEL0837]
MSGREAAEFDRELQSVYEHKPPVSASKIQTLTKLAFKYAKYYKSVVHSIEKFISKCTPEYKLAGLYIIDSIARGAPKALSSSECVSYKNRLEDKLQGMFKYMDRASDKDKERMKRVISLWRKGGIFNTDLLDTIEFTYFAGMGDGTPDDVAARSPDTHTSKTTITGIDPRLSRTNPSSAISTTPPLPNSTTPPLQSINPLDALGLSGTPDAVTLLNTLASLTTAGNQGGLNNPLALLPGGVGATGSPLTDSRRGLPSLSGAGSAVPVQEASVKKPVVNDFDYGDDEDDESYSALAPATASSNYKSGTISAPPSAHTETNAIASNPLFASLSAAATAPTANYTNNNNSLSNLNLNNLNWYGLGGAAVGGGIGGIGTPGLSTNNVSSLPPPASANREFGRESKDKDTNGDRDRDREWERGRDNIERDIERGAGKDYGPGRGYRSRVERGVGKRDISEEFEVLPGPLCRKPEKDPSVNYPKYNAFIKMFTREEAELAHLKLNRYDIDGVVIKVSWGCGFGPRDIFDYATGSTIYPIAQMSDLDRKCISSSTRGGGPIEGGTVVEEPEIHFPGPKTSEIRGPPAPFSSGHGSNPNLVPVRGGRAGDKDHDHRKFGMGHEEGGERGSRGGRGGFGSRGGRGGRVSRWADSDREASGGVSTDDRVSSPGRSWLQSPPRGHFDARNNGNNGPSDSRRGSVDRNSGCFSQGAPGTGTTTSEGYDTAAVAAYVMALLPAKSIAYIAIFEDALDQLAVIEDISPELLGKGGGDLRMKGNELPKILKDRAILDGHFPDALNEGPMAKLKAQGNPKVKHHSSNQVRNSKSHHSNTTQNLLKIQSERTALQSLIMKTIRELKEDKFESLINTVEEEKKKRNTLQNTINRENEASELQRELQKELANERKLLEEETNDRNQVIQQLKDTIQEINGLTNSEQKYIKKETKAHESSVRQRCQTNEIQMLEDKSIKDKGLDLENRVHNVIVDFLTRQRKTLDTQIQDWMTKYEEDTEAKANELEALKQKRSQDLDKFEELVSAYEELEKIVEEDRQNKQREAEERRVLQERSNACIKIQRWWRKIFARLQKSKATAKSAKKPSKKEGKKDGKKGGAAKKKK